MNYLNKKTVEDIDVTGKHVRCKARQEGEEEDRRYAGGRAGRSDR